MTRALIVGRSRIHRDALAAVLARGERVHVVGMASHREEIFAHLEGERPDIVLIGVTMSDVASTVVDIRARAPGVKAVAITLGETEAEVVALAEAGVAGYVGADAQVGARPLGKTGAEVGALAEAGVAGYLVADASLEDLTVAVESAARGELYCSPRVAFTLLCRVGALAMQIKTEEGAGPLSELTPREQDILKLVDQGMSNKEIAKQLGIGVATAKNHVHNILEKLHVHRRINASTWYRRGGFHLKLEA